MKDIVILLKVALDLMPVSFYGDPQGDNVCFEHIGRLEKKLINTNKNLVRKK